MGKQYNRKLTDVFALEQKVARETESFSIQDSIAEQIANALAVTLTSPERELLSKLYTESPEAQTLFLKGRYSWNKATPDGWNRAIAFFNQAIEKDPNYALAHSWLASTYNQLGANGILPPAEASAKAKEAALKALAIDEKQDYAHYVLGTIELFFEWDWPAAEKELERAIELNPNNAEGRLVYAHYLAIVGRTDDAVAEIRKAESVDPLSLLIGASVGKMLFYARKHDEAIEQLQKNTSD